MDRENGMVYVVDDDEDFLDSVKMLLESVDLRVSTFSDAASFLAADFADGPGDCLVLDIRMPGMSGMELQERLADSRPDLPIVFLTAHGDIHLAVRAMKLGAFDFLTKPFSQSELLERVQQAVRIAPQERREQRTREEVRARVESLTPRQREVMDLVVEGLANKVIAQRLAVSQRTVELHRAEVMRRMEADSLADLVRDALVLEGEPSEP